MKQNSWTTRCTQNEAESARETLIWVESVTEKETGNAQPGACVDVLPRCWLSLDCMTACLHQSKFEMSLLLYPETMLSFLWSDIHKPYQSLLITAINYCLRRPLTLLSDATVAGLLVKRCLRSKCWNFVPWWRVTTLIWVIALHQYGISVGSFFRRRFAGKPATEASLNVGSFLRLHYHCSRHNDASFKLYLLLLLWSQVYYQSESQMLWSYSVSRNKLSHSTNFHSLCVKTAQLHLIFYKVDFFVCKMIVPVSFIH